MKGVEAITHFTGVVKKINHELGKIATIIPNFDEPTTRPDNDRFKVKRDILLALGLRDLNASSSSDDSDENDQAHSSDSDQPHYSDSDENKAAVINFGCQRRYGRPLENMYATTIPRVGSIVGDTAGIEAAASVETRSCLSRDLLIAEALSVG